jgi:hypothetical protein
MFNPLERQSTVNVAKSSFGTGTVSGTVSEKSGNEVANSGELARIILEFPSILTIFPLLNRLLQVAARPEPPFGKHDRLRD